LVALELDPPRSCPLVHRWRKGLPAFAKPFQFVALHLAAGWIKPDLVPKIAGDFDLSLGLDRLIVCVHRFDVDGDLVLRAVNVVLWSRIDVITLTGHSNRACGGDFAS